MSSIKNDMGRRNFSKISGERTVPRSFHSSKGEISYSAVQVGMFLEVGQIGSVFFFHRPAGDDFQRVSGRHSYGSIAEESFFETHREHLTGETSSKHRGNVQTEYVYVYRGAFWKFIEIVELVRS